MLLILGGSFDPVHLGHEALADAARAAAPDARLVWVPARQAPHKPGFPPAPAQDRLALLRLAVAARPGETIHTGELERPGPSYTVDTLAELAARHPGERLAWLAGADALEHLARWKQPARIFDAAELWVAPRGGAGEEALERFRAALEPDLARRLRARWLAMPESPHSSTVVREALAAGAPAAGLRPEVEEEIRRRGLYSTDAGPT